MIKNKKTMNHEMAVRVIKEAYECGSRELGMYATGDSFMVKNLHEYVEYAKKQVGYDYLFITTNGGLASPDRVKPVLDAGLDSIKFSINANLHGLLVWKFFDCVKTLFQLIISEKSSIFITQTLDA